MQFGDKCSGTCGMDEVPEQHTRGEGIVTFKQDFKGEVGVHEVRQGGNVQGNVQNLEIMCIGGLTTSNLKFKWADSGENSAKAGANRPGQRGKVKGLACTVSKVIIVTSHWYCGTLCTVLSGCQNYRTSKA